MLVVMGLALTACKRDGEVNATLAASGRSPERSLVCERSCR